MTGVMGCSRNMTLETYWVVWAGMARPDMIIGKHRADYVSFAN
jgi:hypothetical protein